MKIIDNKNRRLVDVISSNIKRKSNLIKSIKIASGFLFLDGWKEFRESIKLNEIVDITQPKIKIIFKYTDLGFGKIISDTILNKEFFMTQYIKHQLDKIDENTLNEISKDFKKLKEKNLIDIRINKTLHSKLYLILTEENDTIEGYGYVGSSNFTKRGLAQPGELNVEITDIDNLKELNNWFEDLWKQSDDIDIKLLLEAITDIRKRKIIIKYILDPKSAKNQNINILDIYLFIIWYILRGVVDIKDIEKALYSYKEFPIKKHNEIAVLNGYYRVLNLNGVILADPVGLGKSFQALGIFELLRLTGKANNLLIIAPPHLIENDQWIEYIKDFYGKESIKTQEYPEIEKYISTYKYITCRDKIGKFEILMLSSYGISRANKYNVGELLNILSKYDTVIIDEAHHFKNPLSKKRLFIERYRDYVRNLKGNSPYFILLTATPIINRIDELLSLISIYANDGEIQLGTILKSTYGKVPQLVRKLKKFEEDLRNGKVDNKLKDDIIEILDKILIMRSRKYIYEKYYNSKVIYPELKNIQYSYSSISEILDKIDNLSLEYTKFIPVDIVVLRKFEFTEEGILKSDPQKKDIVTLKGVINLILKKRLESSIYAFYKTLKQIYNKEFLIYRIINNYLNNTINKDIAVESIYKTLVSSIDDEFQDIKDIENILVDSEIEYSDNIKKQILEIFDNKQKLKDIYDNLKNDLVNLSKILDILNTFLDINSGRIIKKLTDKELQLIDLLNKIKSENGSVIIFTMYKDTAEYLYKILSEYVKRDPKDNIFIVTGESQNKGEIIKKFKNRINEGEFSVLISTDTLSEGVNFPEVTHLINYDIPWTPAILMQRIGRLWRFGRKYNFTYYNFIPTEDIFHRIIEKVEEKIKIIKEILVHEVDLLRKGEVDLYEIEYKIYGSGSTNNNINYGLLDLLKEFSESSEKVSEKDLYNALRRYINEESCCNRKLIDIIKLKEKKGVFKRLIKTLSDGKIINIYSKKLFGDNTIIIGEQMNNIIIYESKTSQIINDNIEKITNIFRDRFNRIKSIYYYKINYIADSIDIENIKIKLLKKYTNYIWEKLKEIYFNRNDWYYNMLEEITRLSRQRSINLSEIDYSKRLEYDNTRSEMLLHLYSIGLGKSRSEEKDKVKSILLELGILVKTKNNRYKLNRNKLMEYIEDSEKIKELYNKLVRHNKSDKYKMKLLFVV